MEQMALTITKLGGGRPLLVTQPVGEKPSVVAKDMVEICYNETQRHSNVFTGEFACCRQRHTITTPDGISTEIDCDKDSLRAVLHQLHSDRLAFLRKEFIDDFVHQSLASAGMDALCHSMNTNKAWFNYFTFKVLEPHIFAEAVSVGGNWKPLEELSQTDVDAMMDECGLSWPQSDNGFYLLCLCAQSGNLPMVRFVVEKSEPRIAPDILAKQNPWERQSALQGAARFGNSEVVRYLCRATSTKHINHHTTGHEMTALGEASKCGHPETIKVLLEFKAEIESRQSDGQTPLIEAAAHGNLECVRILCAAGSDLGATDKSGNTAIKLATTLRHAEVVDELDLQQVMMQMTPTPSRQVTPAVSTARDANVVDELELQQVRQMTPPSSTAD